MSERFTIRRFLADERGATAIEYGLICAMIAVVVIAIAGVGGGLTRHLRQAQGRSSLRLAAAATTSRLTRAANLTVSRFSVSKHRREADLTGSAPRRFLLALVRRPAR